MNTECAATNRSLLDKLTILYHSQPTEVNRSYQMSSFVETKALEQLTKSPVEFVEYPYGYTEASLFLSLLR